MYPVTQDFLDKMKADRRQVLAKAVVDYTDPFMDQSIEISANEQANVSYPQQTADSVQEATHKWASLDGSWVLDGTYHLAPQSDKLSQYQFGWWGSQLAGEGGAFEAPYPALTVTHFPRPIHTLKVIGDTARGEYPVDFDIELYAQDDTSLYTENVTGNSQVNWQLVLSSPVLDVAKQVLTITKWSHEGRQAKIIEFFTSIRETYETGDLVSLHLLEEREASQGSLPVGNISANEIDIRLDNSSRKFDAGNTQSPLYQLLKQNRRIRAWLGVEAENNYSENPPTFSRDSVAYKSDGTQVADNTPRFEPGKFGQAVMVEEGTTNLVINPFFGGTYSNGLAPNWTLYRTPTVYENTNPTYITYGSKSQRVVASAKDQGISQNFTISNDVSYTAKVRVYIVSGRVRLDCKFGTSWGAATISPVGYTGWWEVSVGRVSDGTDGRFYVYSYGDAAEFYVDAAQYEAKAYSTSFIDGTRSPETLTIPTAGVFVKGSWTQEFFYSPTTPQNIAGKTGYLWELYIDDNNHYTLKVGSDGKPYLEVKANGTIYQTATTSAPVLSVGNWYEFACRGSGSQMALLVNGTKVSEVSYAEPVGTLPQYMYLGSDHNGANRANGLYDDYRVSNIPRSDAEIAAACQSGQPLPVDADTTYKLTFNGSIYPVEKVWVPLGTFWSLDWDSPDDTLEATVTARDRMELLRKGTYQSSQVQQNKSLYELAELVLQDAGLSSSEYSINEDLQSIVVPYAWFDPVTHREALRRIAEAGLAAVYADRDGKIRIESFEMTGTTADLIITEDEYFLPLRAPSRQDQVANEIIVDTQPLRPATVAEEVYRSNEPITVPASGAKTVTAFYNSPPVIEAVASLDNPPSGVSIIETTYYGWGASVKIQNSNSTDEQATLVINGKPLTVQNKERAVARDETSITENGPLRYEFPANPLVQTLAQAQAIADTLLASVKDPRRDLEVDWRGNPALLLGDRVTVKGQDYHVIRQEIEWAGALSARLTGRKVI